MHEITFEINSNKEILELFDKKVDHIFIHKFMPNEIIEWWRTDFKTDKGILFKDIKVRNMEMDIQTDLSGLKRLLDLNTDQIDIYQFDSPISDTLQIERLPVDSREKILKQNKLKHLFQIRFEFITVGSFDEEFINYVKTHPMFEKRIKERYG